MAISSQLTTRRIEQKAARRDGILDIAQAVFFTQGYGSATMSGIAASMGGSKSTLWAYFPTKECLFAAVLARASISFEQELINSLTLGTDIEDGIRDFCKAYTRSLCREDAIALHRMVITESIRFPEIGRVFFDYAINSTRRILVRFISSAVESGLLNVADPASAADLLRSLCHGRNFQSLLLNLPRGQDEVSAYSDAIDAATAFLKIFPPVSRQRDSASSGFGDWK